VSESRRRLWRDFKQARELVRSLGLRNSEQWQEWVQSDERPRDIPSNPQKAYREQGWQGLGDWLGTGNLGPKDRQHRPFEEARAYVRSLGFPSAQAWRTWARSDARPADIPASPERTYSDEGWSSWGDWLGTGTIAYRHRVYRPFVEARALVRDLHLRSGNEWRSWSKSSDKPDDVPANPDVVYRGEGWCGWGDWLGTRNIAPRDRAYRPFEEARAFVRSLGLTSQHQWQEWTKSGNRPLDIPTAPYIVYKNDGWQGMGEWLGTGTIRTQDRVYQPFAEARTFARSLELKTYDEWRTWTRSGSCPENIPNAPNHVYKDHGWQGWVDWLGAFSTWNRNAIVSFLRSLIPILPSLDPAELYAIMRQNGLLTASKQTGNTNKRLLTDIVRLASVANSEKLVEDIARELEAATAVATQESSSDAASADEAELTQTVLPPHEEDDMFLPTLEAASILHAVDAIQTLCPNADEEAVEFFIAKAIGKLWREKLATESSIGVDTLRAYPAGEYASVVRSRFLEQLGGAETLTIPHGYRFHENGQILPPNLMQRLVAYRIKEERRLGNWSGTGAGKTMAAILASRVVGARLTLVVGLNNTLDGWRREILKTFPGSTVIIKERGTLTIDPNSHTYLLLNFESFQQPDSSSMVRRLVEDHRIDMVVLDEVHSVKQREAVASKRRQVLGGLLSLAAETNSDLRVLGMSATPVVNNLTEAVSLLEMVRGVKFSELKTNPTIPNVIAVHEKLVVHGVRYKPRYGQVLNEQCIEVPGDSLLDALRTVKKGNVLAMEQVLLGAKLDAIVAQTQPGTLIYSHYIEGIVPRLRESLTTAGFRVAEFTGEDKSGLERFKRRAVDVLIGSSTLGTGVDGLQYVCNRLIIATLPWTSAGYEQLIGRLYRQGSVFAQVDVIIPQVVLQHGEELWSWDIQRRDRIVYKKTLADATVDGVIPEGVLEPESVMLGRALDALHAWIERLERDGMTVIERERLVVPLPEDEKRKAVRAFGDFAHMNARFNTARSSTTHSRLQADPSEWYLYHTLYREARKTWLEVPYEVFAQWVLARPHLIVGDFGCGEALLAASVPNKVYSFDHVAINDSVIACDMARTNLVDSVLDVAVFSLSLMGTNVEDYLREAHRLLRLDGRLRIAEPAGHWQGIKRDALTTMITSLGFQLVGAVQERGSFIYIDALKA